MNRTKTALSVFLALIMVLSLNISAFAASATVDYGFDWQYVNAYNTALPGGSAPALVKARAAGIEAKAQEFFAGYTIEPGVTVMDVIMDFLDQSGLDSAYSYYEIYDSFYLAQINGLGDPSAPVNAGGMSGWMYKVNDVYPSVGASQYVLTDGDTVRWVYVTDYTEIDWDWGTAPASLAEAQR